MGLFPGAIIFVLPTQRLYGTKELEGELELAEFRKKVASDRTLEASAAPPDGANAWRGALYKNCPKCNGGVVHYRNHGCHHIGFGGGCCGHHWCYVCRGPFPCAKCSLMCNDHCGCLLCPDCRPGLPCANCWGCPSCRVKNEDEGFH